MNILIKRHDVDTEMIEMLYNHSAITSRYCLLGVCHESCFDTEIQRALMDAEETGDKEITLSLAIAF